MPAYTSGAIVLRAYVNPSVRKIKVQLEIARESVGVPIVNCSEMGPARFYCKILSNPRITVSRNRRTTGGLERPMDPNPLTRRPTRALSNIKPKPVTATSNLK